MPRAAARLLALLTLAVAAPLVRAGHYQAGTTSGLTATFAGAGHAYPPTYGNGSASASAPGSNGTSTISGTLSTTFTWVPDYVGDTPPTNVVVLETCAVSATASRYPAGGVSASASNGLDSRFCTNSTGGGPIYGPPNGQQTGTAASASSTGTAPHLQSGGSAVTVNDCSPSGGASTSSGPITDSLSYSVTVAPVVLTLSGPLTTASGGYECMVGRGVSGSLSAGGYPVVPGSSQWSIGGIQLAAFRRGEPAHEAAAQTTIRGLPASDERRLAFASVLSDRGQAQAAYGVARPRARFAEFSLPDDAEMAFYARLAERAGHPEEAAWARERMGETGHFRVWVRGQRRAFAGKSGSEYPTGRGTCEKVVNIHMNLGVGVYPTHRAEIERLRRELLASP